MTRSLLLAAAAALVLATPVEAKRVFISYTPIQKLTRADAVVIGKVSALEKNTVDATVSPDAKEKQTYKIAVIKVESGLVGAGNVTHIKVGFFPPPPADPAAPPVRPIRGGPVQVNLTEGQEGVFYLTKHHSGEFYTISPFMAPSDSKAETYKAEAEQVKRAAGVLADPMKALKSDKAVDRAFAAAVLVNKHRSFPDRAGGGMVVTEKVPAEESKLVLKGLAEGNWKGDPNDPNALNSYQAFTLLGLNDKDGWKYPMVKPGEDFIEKSKESFTTWLAGPGKDYQINRLVLKQK